jgi:single-strand DNA-binding protein
MNLTPITIVGNLTDDPELRFTPNGAPVVKFRVASNRQRFDRNTNKWEDAGTDFYTVSAWNTLANNCAETLQKGMRVVVFADQRQRHWKDEKTQENRSAWELTAQAVGPDLTWATATVTKAAKRDQAAPDDPWATGSKQPPAMAGASAAPGSWPQGSGPRGPQGGYSDEPPF